MKQILNHLDLELNTLLEMFKLISQNHGIVSTIIESFTSINDMKIYLLKNYIKP